MRRSSEKGQALTEFVVCIIPIIFVFSGLILVAVLGRANVQNTIQARSAVDLGEEPGKAKVQEILTWDYGKDRVPFTSDDKPSGGARTYYSAEDFDTEKYTVSNTFDRSLNLQQLYDGKYTLNMQNIDILSSVQFSRSFVSDSLRPRRLQHSRLPCLSPTPRACSNSCPSSR